jgi:hypothetical protein
MCFVAHLYEAKYSPSSIATHVSAVAYAHKIMGAHDPTDQFIIRKLVYGATKLSGRPDSRLPITPPILQALVTTIGNLNYPFFHQALLKAVFTLAFFAFLRLGEIAVQSRTKPQYVIQLQDVVLSDAFILLTMHTYKHSRARRPVTIRIQHQQDPICPVRALQAFLRLRGQHQGPFFCFPDLQPLTKSFLASHLATLLRSAGYDPTLYKGHSFRIGAATFAASQGFTATQIQQMGILWLSSAISASTVCQLPVQSHLRPPTRPVSSGLFSFPFYLLMGCQQGLGPDPLVHHHPLQGCQPVLSPSYAFYITTFLS